jgi:hypothetical protein
VEPTRVLEALAAEARHDGLAPIEPSELVPHGRWLHGDEDPSVRRYLVSPAGERWTTVLASATDWHHEACLGLARRLGCRAVYLMLHDGDVFTLTAVLGEDEVVEHVSSPDHFDLPPARRGEAARVAATLLPLAGPGVTAAALEAALTVPGAIDVDGRRSLLATAALLGIPADAALSSYREALEDDGLTPRPELATHVHVAFRVSLEDEGEPPDRATLRPVDQEGPDNLLRFPGPRGS